MDIPRDGPPAERAPRVLATARTYSDLIEAIRARVEAVGAPHEQLEEFIGLTAGHLGKLLGPAEDKRIGMQTLWPLFERLGLVFVVGEHLDIAATIDEMGDLYRRRVQYAVRGRMRKRVSPALMKAAAQYYGSLGKGMPKTFGISPKKLRKKQQHAARARWQRWKLGRN